MDSPSSMPTTHPHSDEADRAWRRLRLAGIALPLAFIVLLQVLRPVVFDRWWPVHGDALVSGLTAAAAVVFGVVMGRVIDRGVEVDRLNATLGERERIARELHDSLAQVLGATNLRLTVLGMSPDLADRPAARAEVAEVAGICREAYTDVREAILGLRTDGADAGLLDGLRSYADKFARQSGIDTVVLTDGGPEPVLTPAREVQVIRIVQEALTNARKHSGTRTARVVVSDDGAAVTFAVEDDGSGFRAGEPSAHDMAGGFGLRSMRERAELVGGSLHVTSAPGAGTRVAVVLPRATRGRVPAMMGA